VTERNAKGQPFSKWLPADKFRYLMPDSMRQFAVEEYEFDDERKWRWDFCWPDQRVAVEIDGFGFGHQAQQCMAQDNEKANAGVASGWRVFRYNSRQLGSKKGVSDAVEQVWWFLCSLDQG
jgi:very-short-patch-repair endonuclease